MVNATPPSYIRWWLWEETRQSTRTPYDVRVRKRILEDQKKEAKFELYRNLVERSMDGLSLPMGRTHANPLGELE